MRQLSIADRMASTILESLSLSLSLPALSLPLWMLLWISFERVLEIFEGPAAEKGFSEISQKKKKKKKKKL